jgi:hypothetical protein
MLWWAQPSVKRFPAPGTDDRSDSTLRLAARESAQVARSALEYKCYRDLSP